MRLLTTGFETGDNSDFSSSGNVVNSSSVTPRTGDYSTRHQGGGANGTLNGFTAGSSVYLGVAIYIHPYSTAGTDVLEILAPGGSNILKITWGGTPSPYFRYYIGTGTLAGTGTVTIGGDTWNYLEMYYAIADSGGRYVIKINGVTDLDYTGDTKPSTDTTMSTIRFDAWGGGGGGNYYCAFDDVVVNDPFGSSNNTWPGVVKLEPIRPNAVGDVTQLTASSGSGWQCVDEVPVSATDYVYGTIVDLYDLYNMATTTLPAGATVKNIVGVAVALMDSGAGNVALVIKGGGSESTGATQALSGTAKAFTEAWSVNPGDSAAWEQADIDSVQIGVKIK
jgi:hypothetical protein